jgi:hypothetical protein
MKRFAARLPKLRTVLAGSATLSLLALGACNTDDILEVVDPDLLNPDGLSVTAGAQTLRYGVIKTFVDGFDGTVDSYAVVTGNMADELRASDTFDGRLLPNKREANDVLPELNNVYLNLHKARTGANFAIGVLQQVAPTPKFNIGELYMYRGYTEDFFGEMYCAGVPFSDTKGSEIIYGMPETTVQTFTRAVASFDTAIANADTSKRILYASQIGKGRALLNNGQYALAAAAVAGVPTTFKLTSDHCVGSGCSENGVWNAAVATSSRYSLGNNEGINGINFLPTVADPRVPWVASTRTGFSAPWINQPNTLKVTRGGANTLADGIEARLIEAEARMNAGTAQADRDATFALLNALRATGITGLAPIAGSAPTTKVAMEDLLFKERALWLYLTGHRLGDLRRLVRQYGRDAETVYPTGEQAAPVAGSRYSTDVNFPIPASEKNNPNFTGCLDRKA